MPLSNALVIAGIVLAFALFAIALAWGDYQTRTLHRTEDAKAPPEPVVDMKKAA